MSSHWYMVYYVAAPACGTCSFAGKQRRACGRGEFGVRNPYENVVIIYTTTS